MKRLFVVCAAVFCAALPQPLLAQQLKAATSPRSVQLNWTQAVIQVLTPPAKCPDGSTPTITNNLMYRSTTAGAEAAPAINASAAPAPATSYNDATVLPGGTYFYKVSATDCAGESGMSNEVGPEVIPNNAPLPGAPTGLQVTAVADNKSATPPIYSRSLQWNSVQFGSPAQIVYYNIYREITGTNVYVKLNPSPLLFPAYFDDTEAKGALYGYRVTAWTLTAGEGPHSATEFTGVTN